MTLNVCVICDGSTTSTTRAANEPCPHYFRKVTLDLEIEGEEL
jgi:hypothetical protein